MCNTSKSFFYICSVHHQFIIFLRVLVKNNASFIDNNVWISLFQRAYIKKKRQQILGFHKMKQMGRGIRYEMCSNTEMRLQYGVERHDKDNWGGMRGKWMRREINSFENKLSR